MPVLASAGSSYCKPEDSSMTPSEVRAAARELVSLHSRFAPLFGR